MYSNVTAQSITAKETCFLTFKPNSLKANIMSWKKEFNMRKNVEIMCKLLLTILFDLTSYGRHQSYRQQNMLPQIPYPL
jgi:hypothetical protein